MGRPEREGVMLAYLANEKRIAKLGKYFYVQPKLNGERGRCWRSYQNTGLGHMVSSFNNPIGFLEHIAKAVQEQIPLGMEADGEFYIHGHSFEQIHSIVSRSTNRHVDEKMIEFHVFDLKMSDVQSERFAYLWGLNLRPPLYMVNPALCVVNEWNPYYERFVALGYEGIIFRNREGEYVEKRTTNLLKMKPSTESRVPIIGVNEGEGWCEGKLGSFVVEDNGVRFKVGSGKLLTKLNRFKLWEIKDTLPGKTLIIKHEPYTTSGDIPKCAVAVRLED